MSGEKPVTIQYFAVLREQRGLARELITTTAATVEDLFRELQAQYGFTLGVDRLRVVVNEAFVPWNTSLNANDTVVFIPPVAGG